MTMQMKLQTCDPACHHLHRGRPGSLTAALYMKLVYRYAVDSVVQLIPFI